MPADAGNEYPAFMGPRPHRLGPSMPTEAAYEVPTPLARNPPFPHGQVLYFSGSLRFQWRDEAPRVSFPSSSCSGSSRLTSNVCCLQDPAPLPALPPHPHALRVHASAIDQRSTHPSPNHNRGIRVDPGCHCDCSMDDRRF